MGIFKNNNNPALQIYIICQQLSVLLAKEREAKQI